MLVGLPFDSAPKTHQGRSYETIELGYGLKVPHAQFHEAAQESGIGLWQVTLAQSQKASFWPNI